MRIDFPKDAPMLQCTNALSCESGPPFFNISNKSEIKQINACFELIFFVPLQCQMIKVVTAVIKCKNCEN